MIQADAVAPASSRLNSLESCAESARITLGCPFSSSDEFETALIRERREAGAYATSSRTRGLMWVTLAGAAVLILLM